MKREGEGMKIARNNTNTKGDRIQSTVSTGEGMRKRLVRMLIKV